MPKKTLPYLEIGFSVFLIALSIMIFWETLSLPPGSFDPLGSAGFPRLISIVIGFLSLLIIINTAYQYYTDFKRTTDSPMQKAPTSTAYRRRPDLALGFYVFALIYVMLLGLRLLSFAICTAVFLFTTMGMLTRFNHKWLPVVILISLVMGFGCQYIFTQIFVIDLP